MQKNQPNLWIEVCNALKNQMNPNSYDMWIAGLQVDWNTDNPDEPVLSIHPKNRFALEHIQNKYSELISKPS